MYKLWVAVVVNVAATEVLADVDVDAGEGPEPMEIRAIWYLGWRSVRGQAL